jgi:hypothetical protein
MNRAPTWDRLPLADLTRSLTATCMGREPADLVDGVTFTFVSPLVE